MTDRYTPTTWIDQELAGDELYFFEDAGEYKSIALDTGVVTVGTPANADNMNNIENGIRTLSNIVELNYPQGYIKDNSAKLEYIGVQSYLVSPGVVEVNKKFLSWDEPLVRIELALNVNSTFYVYLYLNDDSLPAVIESPIAPTWNENVNYFTLGTDPNYRAIGFISSAATNTLRKFIQINHGRTAEIFFIDGNDTGRSMQEPPYDTNWTLPPGTFINILPKHASHLSLTLSVVCSGSDVGILGVSPIQLSSETSTLNALNHVAGKSNQTANFLSVWQPAWLNPTTPFYYKIDSTIGTPEAKITFQGARFIR